MRMGQIHKELDLTFERLLIFTKLTDEMGREVQGKRFRKKTQKSFQGIKTMKITVNDMKKN